MDRYEERCKRCAYSSPFDGNSNGCTSWSCEFIDRKEAIRAYKGENELLKTIANLEELIRKANERGEK